MAANPSIPPLPATWPTRCLCGCGKPASPRATQVHGLAAQGLTQAEIARRLGLKSASYIRDLLRFPPVVAKGHTAPPRVERALFVPRLQELDAWKAGVHARRVERQAERRARWWSIRRPVVSLDTAARNGLPLIATIADPSGDPFGALVSSEIRDVIGDIDMEDVRSMSEADLVWMQNKLVAAGLVSISVTVLDRAASRPQRAPQLGHKEPRWDTIESLGGFEPYDDRGNEYSASDGTSFHNETPEFRGRKMTREALLHERRVAKRS